MLILVLLILSFKKNTKLNIKKIYGNYENTRRLTLIIMRYHGFVDIYVNVFYKPWASGEVFSDLLDKVELLTEENSQTQKKLDFLLKKIKEMKKRS